MKFPIFGTITMEAEAHVTKYENKPMAYPSPPEGHPWRAQVRIGSVMEWQWKATEKEANSWCEYMLGRGKFKANQEASK